MDIRSEQVCEVRGADDGVPAQHVLDRVLEHHRPPGHGGHLHLLLRPVGACQVWHCGVS